jgi:hypothetical protein
MNPIQLNEKEYVEEPFLRQLERLGWKIIRAGSNWNWNHPFCKIFLIDLGISFALLQSHPVDFLQRLGILRGKYQATAGNSPFGLLQLRNIQ